MQSSVTTVILNHMAGFSGNNDRNNRFSRGGDRGGFKRGGFSDRGSRGPAEMHQAVCDNCGKNCEVPFKPTSGKPIYCKDCFEKMGGSERRSESHTSNFERSNDREMFDAVCDNCGKNCQIPFRPTNGRPVYCSDCFEKGNNEPRNDSQNRGQRNSEQTDYKAELQELNAKLDRILGLLTPSVESHETPVEIVTEEAPVVEKKRKSAKKAEPIQE